MNTRIRASILYLSILTLLPLCLVSGGTESPVRFLFFPLMAFFSPYFPSRALHGAGLAFTILFPLLYLFSPPAPVHLSSDLAEISAFFFCTLAVGFISRRIHQERVRYENAICNLP